MAEVASAFVSLLPSARGFGSAASRQIDPQMDRAGKSAGGRFAGGLKAAIGPAAAILGTVAIGSFLKGSVDQASNLNETLSKSSVIFGKQAREIENFGNTAARNLGLSKEQAIASAAGFGDMFTQIGFTDKEASKFSQSVVKMSADLGSFNNLETSDVTDRMAAAFRGEYDSLQAVIPNINAARVESEALAATGKKTAKELTAQEKATAVLAIVNKDGARAQGDFARTSGGLANQQKILSAQTADLQAKIGRALVPVLAKVATFVNQHVFPALVKLGPVFSRIGAYIAGFFSKFTSGTATSGARFEQFKTTVMTVFASVKSIISSAVSIISSLWNAFGATILKFANTTLKNLMNQIRGIFTIIQGIFQVFSALLKGDWKGVWDGIKKILSGAVTVLKAAVSQLWNTIRTVFSAGKTAVVAIVKGLGSGILSAASAAFGKLKDGAKAGWETTKTYVEGLPGKIKTAIGDLAAIGLAAGKELLSGLASGLADAVGLKKIAGAAKGAAKKIKGFFPGSPVKAGPLTSWNSGGAGKRLMGMLADGMVAGTPRVTAAASRAAKGASGAIRKGLSGGSGGLDVYLKTVKKSIADSLKLRRTRPGMSKKERAAVADYNDAARKAIKSQKAAVDQLEKSLSRLTKRVDAAKSKLNGLKEARAALASQTASSISGELSLTETGGKRLSFATVAANVSGLASRAKAFAGKLRALLSAGIPAGLVQEVAALGTVEGIRVADALLSGSKQQIGQLAKDYAGVSTYSKQIGDVVAGGMYDAGIRAQEGILKGLLDDKAIQRAADRLARKLTRAVKKSLGIKSPSRVFQNEVGKYIPAGVVAGIDDGQRALDRRVAGMVSAASPRDLRAGMDFASGVAASASATPQFNVYPQPGQSEEEIGRAAANRLMWAMT